MQGASVGVPLLVFKVWCASFSAPASIAACVSVSVSVSVYVYVYVSL